MTDHLSPSRLDATSISGLPVVASRHPLRWLTAAVVLFVAVVAGDTLVENDNFQWQVVGHYLFNSLILHGLWVTIWLTVVSMVIGIVLGLLLAVMRMSSNPFVSGASRIYIWFFRGTPVLVQLVFWYNLAALFPTLSFGIPFGGPTFVTGSANTLISPY